MHRRATTLAALIALAGPLAAQTDEYTLVEGWAELPEGVDAWGMAIGVEMDRDGSLWVFHRCFDSSCRDRPDVPPVLRYDPQGSLIDSWGEGLFVWPHGFFLDDDGFLWTSDAQGRDGVGHQVIKFTREGDEVLRLGVAGERSTEPGYLDGPADVVVADNGDIFVSEGHGGNRIVKFSPDGEFLMAWGMEGTGPGEFDEAHCIDIDSLGRIWVGDRVNQRIQLFDQDGRFLDEWTGIMASGIHITDDDIVYVADYQLREGIVIARASDFTEIGFVSGTLPEGVAIDRDGNVFAAEAVPRNLKKFERRPGR